MALMAALTSSNRSLHNPSTPRPFHPAFPRGLKIATFFPFKRFLPSNHESFNHLHRCRLMCYPTTRRFQSTSCAMFPLALVGFVYACVSRDSRIKNFVPAPRRFHVALRNKAHLWWCQTREGYEICRSEAHNNSRICSSSGEV